MHTFISVKIWWKTVLLYWTLQKVPIIREERAASKNILTQNYFTYCSTHEYEEGSSKCPAEEQVNEDGLHEEIKSIMGNNWLEIIEQTNIGAKTNLILPLTNWVTQLQTLSHRFQQSRFWNDTENATKRFPTQDSNFRCKWLDENSPFITGLWPFVSAHENPIAIQCSQWCHKIFRPNTCTRRAF